MANHIKKIGAPDLHAPMRFVLNSSFVVLVLAAIAATTHSLTAGARNLPNPQSIAQLSASTGASPATGPAATTPRTFSRTGEARRLFLGFLEFDWDPNAPGGVPGFGPWPDPTRASNR